MGDRYDDRYDSYDGHGEYGGTYSRRSAQDGDARTRRVSGAFDDYYSGDPEAFRRSAYRSDSARRSSRYSAQGDEGASARSGNSDHAGYSSRSERSARSSASGGYGGYSGYGDYDSRRDNSYGSYGNRSNRSGDYGDYGSYGDSARRGSAYGGYGSYGSYGNYGDSGYGGYDRGNYGSHSSYNGSGSDSYSDYDSYGSHDGARASRRSASDVQSRRRVSDEGASQRSAERQTRTSTTSRARHASPAAADGYRETATSYERGRGRYTVRESLEDDFAPMPKRSNRRRNIIIAVAVALVIVLIGAGAALAYVNSISSNLHEGVDEELKEALTPTSLGDEPFYMLLLGTDTSVERAQDEEIGDTVRSDSMILARIDPVNKKVALISIHRDTMVDLGEYGEQKINAAFEIGGPAGAVKAVSDLAGVPIAHYASVDFDGFRAIVDALGGVEVNVPIEIDDPQAGGIVHAGLQTLTGEQALVLCRSRHSYDDLAGDGDVMRAANQRVVIGAIAKKVLSSDIMTIANTVQAMSQYVTTDLEISDIIGLAQLFQGINPDTDIYTAMEPTTSAFIDETWYEFLDEEAWREMIARMDKGLPPVATTEIDEVTGTVLSTAGDGDSSGSSAAASASGSASSAAA